MPLPSSNCEGLLEYEKEIMLEMFNEDGLLIMARGLGIDRIYANFMRIYCHSSYFVLALNVGIDDLSIFVEQLREDPVASDLHILDSTSSVSQRNTTYAKGGMFIVTTRILVTDLLSHNLPCESITGILVFNAQNICDSNQERFILRMYRERNANGFVKAFSDDPMTLMRGICKIENVMKSLFIRQLFIWPRFHSLVHNTLDGHQPNVNEVIVEMTPKMKAIQLAIFDIIQSCLQELKRNTKYLDAQMLTVENAIFPWFHRYLRKQLAEVWNEIGFVCRQLVFDLKVLQNVLISLYRYNSITFAKLIDSLRSGESRLRRSGWILTNSADRMFSLANERLYVIDVDGHRTNDLDNCAIENVKLNAIRSTIMGQCRKSATPERPNLIISLDESSSVEIKRFLECESGQAYMRDKLCEQMETDLITKSRKHPLKRKSALAFGQMFIDHYLLANEEVGDTSEIILDIYDPPTAICPLSNLRSCQINLLDVLKKCKPSNVILFDCQLHYVRQIELYCALHSDQLPTIYCLTNINSAEEQIYLSTIQSEKAAMDELIKKKATIVIPDTEQLLSMASRPSPSTAQMTSSSRLGGSNISKAHDQIKSDNTQQQIVVDVRELRSELPSMLYKLNIELIPVTLEVGDYVLTPDICVERKSLNDLIGSMSDGRLYTQILMMSRHYEKPVLLIEYNREDETFSLKNNRFGNSKTTFNSKSLCSKLVLLTIHFPQMRIIWSSCPRESAEIFNDLKINRQQPNRDSAVSITNDVFAIGSKNYNELSSDLLLKVPGVTSRNHRLLMDNVRDITHLATMSETEIAKIIDNKMAAEQIYEFLNSQVDRQ